MTTHCLAEAKIPLSKPIECAFQGEPIAKPITQADIEWLHARRIGRTMPKTDAGTFVSEVRNEGEK